jgi:hypothetical protein
VFKITPHHIDANLLFLPPIEYQPDLGQVEKFNKIKIINDYMLYVIYYIFMCNLNYFLTIYLKILNLNNGKIINLVKTICRRIQEIQQFLSRSIG